MSDPKESEFFNRLMGDVESSVTKEALENSKQATFAVVVKLRNGGYDDEEIRALLLGAVETMPGYNSAMQRFYELQIDRALKQADKT